MSRKIRLGNDIDITWSLLDKDEQPYIVEGRDFAVEIHIGKKRFKISNTEASGNSIHFIYYGKDQKVTGPATLVYIENGGRVDMVTFDTKDVFTMVEHSWLAVDSDEQPETVTLDVVTVLSNLESSIGPRGYSAYEIAVQNGYHGTEEEWLASLKPHITADADGNVYCDGVLLTDVIYSVVSEVTVGEQGRQEAESNRVAAETTRENRSSTDHQRAESDHSRAEQDHQATANAVLYTPQSLTDSQKEQARTNIGAGTYSKPSGGIPSSDLADGVIPDVSQFITKSVNDLVNYYLKSETYTKAEVQALISAIQQFHYEVYASISAVTNPANNILYLIGPTGSGSDKYEEYVYDSTKPAAERWIKIGDTSIDLSGYVTTEALNAALADYVTSDALATALAGLNDVKYTPQSLTDAQKLQARTNIGATAPEVFWAVYGTTTVAEIEAALNAGKIVAMLYSNKVYFVTANNATNYLVFTSPSDDTIFNIRVNRSDSSYGNPFNLTYEQAGRKKSTISGNESSDAYYPTTKAVADFVAPIQEEVTQLEAEVNGGNRETPVSTNWSNGYIIDSNGVVSGGSQTTYQRSDAIELTDDMQTIRCYGAPNAASLASVGFYTISALPVSSGQASRTVGVIVNTQTGTDNTVIEIGADKIAEMKAGGAHYFCVCVLASGTKGISYFTVLRGIVDAISDLDDKVDSYDAEIESIENGVVQETEQPSTVFEYGYITTDGKFPNPGSGTTFSRTSPIGIGNIIGIRAMAMLNSADGGGVFFFKTNAKPTTQANADLVGVIGGHSTSTAGYVNEEITITREQIRQMQALGAKYFAVSSYTDGAELYTSEDVQDGLLQINEKIANLESVTETCRKRIDITLQDTQDEILAKLIKAYDGEDYDVFWECGTYQFDTVWVTMRTMSRFNSIGTWEMPIGGKNNRYFFNGSIIIGSGIYDLIGSYCQNSNLFGTLRKGNHTFDLYDATFIISDGNYCFHDETSSEPGSQVHRYNNIKFINIPTEHSSWIHTGFALGNGQNMTIILDKCYFDNTDGEPCVRNHGMEHIGETAPESHSRVIFSNNYFKTEVNMGHLDLNENCDLVFNGNSYISLVVGELGHGTYHKYIFCNEQRSE